MPLNDRIIPTTLLVLLGIIIYMWVYHPYSPMSKKSYQVGHCYQEIGEDDQNPFDPIDLVVFKVLDKKGGWIQYRYCKGRDPQNKHSKKDGYYQETWREVPCPEGCN